MLWLDYARGIAIVLVVVCHVVTGLFSAGVGGPNAAWNHFYEICYAFMVPVFFVVAGWLAARTRQHKGPAYQLRQVGRNVVYPYVVWSLLQAVVMLVTGAGNHGLTWGELPGILLRGWMQFWFLHSLILSYGLDALLRGLGCRLGWRLGVGVGLLLLPYSGWPYCLETAATHYVYFVAGAWCFSQDRSLAIGWRCALAAGGGALLVGLHFAGIGFVSRWQPLLALAGISACFATASLLSTGRGLAWLGLLGRHTLEVYCMHIIFGAGVRLVLLHLGIHSLSIHIAVGVLAALGGPLLLAQAFSRKLGFLFRLPERTAPRTQPPLTAC